MFKIKSVFKKQMGFSYLSDKAYYTSVAALVTYGLFLTSFLAASVAPEMPTFWFKILIGFLVPIIGIFLSNSANPKVGFVGYNLIVAPIGLVLGPVANFYSSGLIAHVALITGMITSVMIILGLTFPSIFRTLGGFLFYSLIGLVLVRLVALFFPSLDFKLIDYISAGIFSLYIGYDMYRASMLSKTWNNVIGVAVSLYLDILNLFLSVLSIFRRN